MLEYIEGTNMLNMVKVWDYTGKIHDAHGLVMLHMNLHVFTVIDEQCL